MPIFVTASIESNVVKGRQISRSTGKIQKACILLQLIKYHSMKTYEGVEV
jgi:hypothetical protein